MSAISILRLLTLAYSFTAAARSRIEWLEDQVRRLSPSFNLDDGPKVDFGPTDRSEQMDLAPPHSNAAGSSANRQPSAVPSGSTTTTDLHTINSQGKRAHSSFSESDVERPFTDEARSVALDL